MVNFEENYHFSRFQWVQHFRGGPTFSRGGGSTCLFPIETHITCDFPGGSGPPVPPSGSALDAPAVSMRAPYDYLKSLRSYYYLNSCGVLTISVRCPYADHAINLRCIYGLWAFFFFQNLSECGVNIIVEATMPVNPYDDDWVSLC